LNPIESDSSGERGRLSPEAALFWQ